MSNERPLLISRVRNDDDFNHLSKTETLPPIIYKEEAEDMPDDSTPRIFRPVQEFPSVQRCCLGCGETHPLIREWWPIQTVVATFITYQYLRKYCKVCWAVKAHGKKPSERINKYNVKRGKKK